MKKVISILLCALLLIGILPMGIFASSAEDVTYTMWGNNILQAFIRENELKYNDDGSLSYEIKPTARYEMLCAALTSYSPDVVALQECDLGWHYLIDDYDGYATENGISTFADIGYANVLDADEYTVEGVRNPIYYKADKFTVVASGVVAYGDATNAYYEDPWVFTWAILRDKANGNQFAVSSTHIISAAGDNSAKAEEIGELVAFMKNVEVTYNVPFVSMGDYNCDPTYAVAYTAFGVGENVLSARDVSKVVEGNNYRTTNSLTQLPKETNENGSGVIDHAMISTRGIAPEKYQTLVETFDTENNISTYSYSDHIPQLFTFRVVGMEHEHTYDKYEQYSEAEHQSACTECYLVGYEAHTFGEEYTATEGADTHERICTKCSYEEKSAHTIASGEMVDDDTHEGLCSVCNTVGIGAHVYSWTEKDSDNCDGICACGATATRAHEYTYTSNDKGTDDTHTALCACGNTAADTHTWNDGKVTNKATYADDGVMTYTCTLCGETRDEAIDMLTIPESPFELGEGGQQHYYTGEATEKAPVANGVVNEGEYSLEIKDIKVENDEDDDRVYLFLEKDKKFDIENVNIYVSQDDDYIYLAAEVVDKDMSYYGDSVNFYIGTSGKTNELSMFYIPRVDWGGVEAYPYGVTVATPQAAEAAAAPYVKAKATVASGNKTTYELVLKRDAFSEEDFEDIFFGVMITTADATNSAIGNIYFGFETEGLSDTYPVAERGKFYTHVLTLGAEPTPETDTPVTDTPVTDAPVTDAPVTDTLDTSADEGSGCGSSIATLGVSLVAILGTCTTFIIKKKEH